MAETCAEMRAATLRMWPSSMPGRLVSATYPLSRYRDAIEHAASAGARGAVKVAFDLRNERERHE